MIPIYIGYDRKETVAFHVLSHSILSRSTKPVSVTPINRDNLKESYIRPRAEVDSTDFSNSRWIVPYLQEYKGWAIFMDCDMLCLADIAELWAQRDDRYAVMVKQHNHVPKETKKFLDQDQHKYERKNWSSLMLMNCAKCHSLTSRQVNTAPGLHLHQFRWLKDDQIGAIQGDWNLLVGYDKPTPQPKLVHFTSGGPWHGYHHIDYGTEWYSEMRDMLQGDNPVSYQ